MDDHDLGIHRPSGNIDPVDLLTEHYEAVDMRDDFRRDLLAGTRSFVAARRRRPLLLWARGLAAAAAAIVVFVLAWQIIHPKHIDRLVPGHQDPIVQDRRDGPGQPPSLAPTPRDRQTPVAEKSLSRLSTTAQKQPGQIAPSPHDRNVSGPPLVAIISIRQPVTDRSGRALSLGDKLPASAVVRTGPGGRVILVTRKGSELCLDSSTVVVFRELSGVVRSGVAGTGEVTASITRGRLYCSNRDKEIARIDTPAGHVRLLGTVVDTAVVRKNTVAVTVVEGRVELSNAHGDAVVDAGKRSMLTTYRAPQPGVRVNTYKETSWYQGRGEVQSDFGDIAFQVRRGEDLISEIWAMNIDGSNRRRVRSFLGYCHGPGSWLPGERWLSVETGSLLWSTPNPQERIAHAHSGHPITGGDSYLVDAVTGRAARTELPEGYRAFYCERAPDPALMAFCGGYLSDSEDRTTWQYGVWLLDQRTGKVSPILKGDIKSAPAWSPDSKHIAISDGQGYTSNHHLVTVDVRTGQVRDLKVNGAGACWSPDGTKIAYCGDFKRSNAWWSGVPDSGSIFVLSLASGAKPVRVSSARDDALMPRWSPDSRRLAYRAGCRVCVVTDDGADTREVYRASDGELIAGLSWDDAGTGVYVKAGGRGPAGRVVLAAADGSGLRKIVDPDAGVSKLAPSVQAQTDAACAAIREAVFCFAMGEVYSFEGDTEARSRLFGRAADIFASLPWNYPLSGLGSEDTLRYADAAQKEAQKPDDEVLRDSCAERMRYFGNTYASGVVRHHQFPPDMKTALEWAVDAGWRMNWLSSYDERRVMMLGMCPGTQGSGPVPYTYNLPVTPSVGDVIVTCPNHSDNCVKWSEEDIASLDAVIMSDKEPGGWCALRSGIPYRFENVGTEPATVIYHALEDAYEIRGTVKLLPVGTFYWNETIRLGPMDEGSVARAIDSGGPLDWGHLPERELAKSKDELEFCRAVAESEAGKPITHYFSIDGEPAKPIYIGEAGGACSAPGHGIDLVGPGRIEVHWLLPSGRFHVRGTIRMDGRTCKNGWLDKYGRVIATER